MGRGAVEMARHLRRVMTPEERLLWGWLRDRRAHGLKFRRQAPFEGYILDFYCAEMRLVVEVDGGVHREPGQRARDELRDRVLAERGLQVLRVSNEEVAREPRDVIARTGVLAEITFHGAPLHG